ncbi:MAG: TatD family hydrolase [Candidatus Omnitrophota bacterium]
MFIDTHCHLDFPEFNPDRDEVIRRAEEAGITSIVNIGSSLEGSRESLALARKYKLIFAAVGIHPHEADVAQDEAVSDLRTFAREDKVVAIGEIGLDYFKNYSDPKNQRALFIKLLNLAKELDLPVVIHSRSAQGDTLKILKEENIAKAVMHCFSADEVFLKSCLDLGFFISFTCNVTYKKAENLRELVKVTPLERLMLETDAPFLAPLGLRGRRNEPLYVKALAEEVARIKGIDTEEVARITTENAESFFSLK